MKLTADRAALAEAAAWVAQVVAKNARTPILAGVRLTAADGRLTIRGFDYDTAHTAHIDAEVHEPGEAIVAGRFLSEIVGALSGPTVDVTLDDTRLSLSAGRATYRAAVLPVEDFPTLPDFPTEVGTVSADNLRAALGAVRHAPDPHEDNAGIAGLRFEDDAGSLRLVGLNRQVAASITVEWSGGQIGCQVPVAATLAATKGLTGDVRLGWDGTRLGFATESREVTLTCYAGEFAKWRLVIPSDDLAGVHVSVRAEELAESVKRAALIIEGQPVRLAVSESEVGVTGERDSGDGDDAVDCTADGTCEVGINPAFLLGALGAADGGPVDLFIPNALNKAVRITVPGSTFVGAVAKKPGMKEKR